MKNFIAVLILLTSLASCTSKDKDNIAGGAREDGTYFKLTINGEQRELENIHYARTGKTVHLATWGANGFPNLNVTMTTKSEDDFRGQYYYFYDMSPGTGIILYGLGQSDGYESHWWDCPGEQLVFIPSPGKIIIENIERSSKGEFITGRFDVEQYQPRGNCPYPEVRTVKISATFRLKRAE